MAGTLILIANPGSASRKYALYKDTKHRASLHFENANGAAICMLDTDGRRRKIDVAIAHFSEGLAHALTIFQENNLIQSNERIEKIGIRIVAPGGYFLRDHVISDEVIQKLETLLPAAPLHIEATLHEIRMLRAQFPQAILVGVSDSAFHNTKPDRAWNYGIRLEDADRFDIKRFGYHGISLASAVRQLADVPSKLIVCHLGSGASVTAVENGKSIDTTMGYSPLEGMIMATRSGTIDFMAVKILKESLNYTDEQIEDYLFGQSGLQGLGGSNDLRELLAWEANGSHRARLAMETYILSVQKAIGQMIAALGGVDDLVFTGTVGERSAPIRKRVVQNLHYVNIALDKAKNETIEDVPRQITIHAAGSKPVYVIPAREADEMVRRVIAA